MATLNEFERAILIAANEDYLSLGEAVLEARAGGQASAKAAVITLLREGYVYLYEIEQVHTTIELQCFELEDALRIVDKDDAWTPPLEHGERFYALFAADRGKRQFKRLIGAAQTKGGCGRTA